MSTRLLPVGPAAVLVEVGSTGEALSLALHLRAAAVAADVVPAAATVLVDGLTAPRSGLDAVLATWEPSAPPADGPLVEVPVVFDGEDLAAVASHWGCASSAEVVARLVSVELVSAFCGFAPGFSYLSGLPWPPVPRLASPRPRVPAGAVALAGEWAGIYPTASPGGWRLVGRTSLPLWDVDADPPALLAPGVRVRFVEAPA